MYVLAQSRGANLFSTTCVYELQLNQVTVAKVTDPLGGATRYAYDPAGNLVHPPEIRPSFKGQISGVMACFLKRREAATGRAG